VAITEFSGQIALDDGWIVNILAAMHPRLCFALCCFITSTAWAQSSNITYQGRLTMNGSPANGTFDIRINIYDAAIGGNQIGVSSTNTGVIVQKGIFTTIINAGKHVFTGEDRWAEVSVATNGNTNFSTLTPRNLIASAPYALMAKSSGIEVLKVPAYDSYLASTSELEGFSNSDGPGDIGATDQDPFYGGISTNLYSFERRSTPRHIEQLRFLYNYHEHFVGNISDGLLQFEIWRMETKTNGGGAQTDIFVDTHFVRSVSAEVQLIDSFVGQWESAPTLTNVDLTIHAGEFLALRISGAGKTNYKNPDNGFYYNDFYQVEVEAIVCNEP
jgi:hypothetical protein